MVALAPKQVVGSDTAYELSGRAIKADTDLLLLHPFTSMIVTVKISSAAPPVTVGLCKLLSSKVAPPSLLHVHEVASPPCSENTRLLPIHTIFNKLFSYQAILSSLNDALSTSTSPSLSMSIAKTDLALSAEVLIVFVEKPSLPSFSYQEILSSSFDALTTSISPSLSMSIA